MADPRTEKFHISYEDSADRVPVLWIHGYPLSNLLWDLQVSDLADISRQIAPDLRGFGQTNPTDPPYSMQLFADDCIGLLDHLGLSDPVVIGGLSMGGYVAMEICRRYPDRVSGLILAATRAGADSDEAKSGRDEAAAVAEMDGVEAIVDSMLPRLMAPQAYKEQPTLVEFVREMMLESTVPGIVGAMAAMRDRVDSTADLSDFDVPALVIHGAQDQLIPVSEAEVSAAALPQGELVIVPGAGHLPNLERPDEFNAAVREFLDPFYDE